MTRRLRHNLAMAVALGAAGGLGGCSMHAGYGGHGGYGGYTRGGGGAGYGYGSTCRGDYYRISGGTETFLVYAGIYAGAAVVAGLAELVEWCLE